MQKNLSINNHGFSLVEVLVSILIISILTLGIFSLIILSIKISTENQHYIEAVNIANQQMELIRNMSYDQVGVISGIPAGILPATASIERNGHYTVNNYVTFYDDPFDGEIGSTTKPDTIIDYKIATIKVSWRSNYGSKNVTIFSKIIPRTEETTAGYGLLKISVVTTNGLPIAGASVRVINPASSTDVTNLTNTGGILYLPAPACYQCYKIIVSSIGYSTDQTYPATAENPVPTKINLSVSQGNKQEELFTIDPLATLNIHTYSNSSLPDNWQVNENRAGEEKTHVRFSTDSSDNMYFVWQSTNPSSSTVYMQKFNSSLTKQWGSNFRVYDNSKFQKNPDIVTTASGQSFVVWQDNSSSLKALSRNNDLNKKTKYASTLPSDNSETSYQTKNKKNFLTYGNAISGRINSFFVNTKIKLIRIKDNVYNKLATKKEKLRGKKVIVKNDLNTRSANAAVGTVTYVGTSGNTTGGSTNSIVLNVPAGVQIGDLLLAFVYNNDYSRGPVTSPGYGWQVLNNNLRPTCNWMGWYCDARGAILWKIVAAGDPSSYTFTLANGTARKAGNIRAYRDTNTSDPFAGSLQSSSSNEGDILRPAPSQTVSSDGSMLVCGWGSNDQDLGTHNPTISPALNNIRNSNANSAVAISADLPVAIADSPTNNRNFDANYSLDQRSVNWSLIIQPAVVPDDATVSANGNHTSAIIIPNSNQYFGGKFIIVNNTATTHNVKSITIHENGTINAAASLENIKFLYSIDNTAPYDCADFNYSGTESQFGLTTNFDLSNTAVATDSGAGIEISPTRTMCVFIIGDVNSNGVRGDTINFSIDDPSTEVQLASGTVIPATAVALGGSTVLQKPAEMQQIDYRWRNDDGSETAATWNASENIPTSITKNQNIRLRFEITNGGDTATNPINYQIQYGEKITTCDSIAAWTNVPNDNSGHWKMTDSSFITDAEPTTNSSGLSDQNTNFKAGEMKDADNQTSAITLQSDEFTELEYSLTATLNANDSDYCFRLTNAGSVNNFNYIIYPQIAIIGDDNIYITLLNNDGTRGATWPAYPKRVNSDSTNFAQINPVIAYTENFGSATSVVAWEDYRDGNADIYMQGFDLAGNKLWTSGDKIVANSADTETAPAIIINENDEIVVVWVNNVAPTKIYMQKFNLETGNRIWGSDVNIVSSSNNVYAPRISLGESNSVYVAWTDDSGTDKNAMIGKFDNNGTAIWPAQNANLTNSNKDQYDPDIFYRNGFFYVSWTDKRENNEDIYAQKYNASGSTLWADDLRISINLDASAQNKPSLLINSLGDPYGTWADYRNGDSNIYATKFGDPGAGTNAANIPLIITGTKRIGENPIILKNVYHYSTNASGELTLNVEMDSPGGYTIATNPASTTSSITSTAPTQPFIVLPGEIKSVSLFTN